MSQSVKYVGLDVHKDTIAVAVAEGGKLGNGRAELVGDLAPLDLGGLCGLLGKGGGDEGRDDAAAAASRMGQGIAGEVNAAALPGGIEDAGDRRLDV